MLVKRKHPEDWPQPNTAALQPVTNLHLMFGEGINFYRDKDGLIWMKITPTAKEHSHGKFAPKCYQYCPHHLSRPHLTCLSCRVRRVLQRKIPEYMSVQLYVVAIWYDRPFQRIKSFILKRLLSLIECFAS